ncbi:MAG: LysR family transcriptional regulator [Rhodospirillales bacterium]|nr:LysR family transcriptional regulator [Rhodospirillales bacterium]
MTVKKQSSGPDWSDLRVFVELVRQKSLSGAARALGVTHATIARRVARLESMLGQSIVDRRAGGYAPTAEGARIAVIAGEMEARALAIARRASGTGPAIAGTIRLTATEGFASVFLMPRLGAFAARYPGLDIEIIADIRNLSLARRDADLALRLGRPKSEEIVARKLADLGYGFYAAHAYLERRAPSAALAGGDRYIGYDAGTTDLPEARHLAAHAGDARAGLRSNSLLVQVAAARAGLGVALLPHFFAASAPELVRLDVRGAGDFRRELWLLIHRDLRRVPRVRAAVDFLVATMRREQGFLAGTRRQGEPAAT